MPLPLILPIGLILGFVSGIVVNFLADYLPAKRHYDLSRSNPFVSRDVIPPKPRFKPFISGRSLWSGTIAALQKAPLPDHPRRHVITEIGLALAFAAIAWVYGADIHLPFLLFYAAVFVLICIIDLEHRWIMFETIWPPALVAIAEAAFLPRISLIESLRGGLYGFLCMYGLYILGIVFAKAVSILTGRRVGRTVLGFGDVRMATLSGFILGWGALGPAMLIMIFSGAIAALIFILNRMMQKRRYRMFSAIAYGPYIVIGTAIMLYIPWIPGDVLAFFYEHGLRR